MGLAFFPFQHENNVFWIWSIRPLHLCPKVLSIHPPSCHLTVSTKLHCRPLFTCVDDSPRVRSPSVSSRYLSFPFLSMYGRQFHTVKCEHDKFCLISECTFFVLSPIQSSFLDQSYYLGSSVLWVYLVKPTGVPSDAEAGWHRGHNANPNLLHCCAAAALLSLH